LVVTGYSAGGHLALTTGLLPSSAGLDLQCPGNEPLEVAAIVNWYGITDVGDLLDGKNMKSYAVQWMASMPDRYAIAERVSPQKKVRLVEFIDQIPKAASGKILRRVLIDRELAKAAAATEAPSAEKKGST
jgi:acetyl esterase/lipase